MKASPQALAADGANAVNWNGGELITLNAGVTATCTGGLNKGQLYALFFYNHAGNPADTTVTVTGNDSLPPVNVVVPGITANQGLAALCFVSGDDTATVAASIVGSQPGASLQAFIGSAEMPTNTAGINNLSLPADAGMQPFQKFARFYTVSARHWYAVTLTSNNNPVVSVQFEEDAAEVNAVNYAWKLDFIIAYYGPNAQWKVRRAAETAPRQTTNWFFFGRGQQTVWINVVGAQNSETASIGMQSLQT